MPNHKTITIFRRTKILNDKMLKDGVNVYAYSFKYSEKYKTYWARASQELFKKFDDRFSGNFYFVLIANEADPSEQYIFHFSKIKELLTRSNAQRSSKRNKIFEWDLKNVDGVLKPLGLVLKNYSAKKLGFKIEIVNYGKIDSSNKARHPNNASETKNPLKDLLKKSLDELGGKIPKIRGGKPQQPRETKRRDYERSPYVEAYTIKRALAAKKVCEIEGCKYPSFDWKGMGIKYVEVHHITPLSDGGYDIVNNTACVCPSHHRELHSGEQAKGLTQKLRKLRKDDGPKTAKTSSRKSR